MNQLETAIAQGQYDTVFEALKNSISATSEHDNLNEVVATLAKHLSKTQTPVEEKVVALEVTNKKR